METAPRRGLFLDLDGTLADSLSALRAAYDRFMRSKGLNGRDQEFLEFNGPPIPEIVSVIKQRYGLKESVAALTTEYFEAVRETYRSIPPSEGAEELLNAAAGSGWVCAVVTSNSEEVVNDWLARVELSGFVQRVIGSESVPNGKPAPDPYLKAITTLGCAPGLSLAVEDSEKGLLSASSAGLKVFAYCHPANAMAPLHLDRFERIARLVELIPVLSKQAAR